LIVIAEILWPIAFVVAAFRLAKALEAFAPKNSSDEEKEDPYNVDIPNDLLAIATAENEVWAQEEVVRVIRERYENLRDWNKVRAAMGVGRID
jgi:hypothetical protein